MRTGRLDMNEQAFIEQNVKRMTLKEIAAELGRTQRSVRDFVNRQNLAVGPADRSQPQKTELKAELRKKPFYGQVAKQLSPDELNYFEQIWIDTVVQFEFDIRPTEELQLKQLILMDIQIDRINIQKKQHLEDLTKKQMLLNQELEKDPELRDREVIDVLQSEIGAIRSSINTFGREAKDIISEQKHVRKDLKATRDQRAETIDDSKLNFVSWLKVVQDLKYREKVGKEMEILRQSQKNAKDKLGEYTSFADGTVERSIINAETVKRENNEDSNN